ncbi:MAG: 2-C-methyl-D-erythritol 4-phosphate cytidylyltransferase [Betaproteobacteria bacterium]|nr:2-C-methyl-D-erythritol 4-phosphate cytidylyltransferase [Betaproteobacteria bacterium]
MSRYFALLPAAGVGARMGADQPKQYLELQGHPMLWHAIRAFDAHPAISAVQVVISPEDGWWDAYDWSGFCRLRVARAGGASRAASVLNGLSVMDAEAEDWVLVHDAARPCLSRALLDKLLDELSADPVGGILAAPVADTLKRAGEGGRIQETVSRERLWGAQTPQMFRYGVLRSALERAGSGVTDEASAVEALGMSPRLVESDRTNLKVTFPDDLALADWLLSRGS